MKKYFYILIISLIVIQCNNKELPDLQTSDTANTNKALKTLSQEDVAFLEKIKNKIIIIGNDKYIFKDNGDIEYSTINSYEETIVQNYVFESSLDGTNAYYYHTYNIREMYQKAPNNIATNYKGFSVKNGILYEDNYEGYDMDPNETIIRKWERENYYSNYYYTTVKENPNFDNFHYENKSDVTFDKFNEKMIGILILEEDYKPYEVGDIEKYNFDGTYTNNNSSIELKKKDNDSFYLYAINIDKDEKGNAITNIQSTDTNKMILKKNQYVDTYTDINVYGLYYGEVAEVDLSYVMYIQPMSRDALMITEPNRSCGFAGIYKKSLQMVDSNDKSTKEKAFYDACKWYAQNYDEINRIDTVDFDGGGYYDINMENVYLYISKFKNSGYFSDNYIKNLENQFKYIKNDLQENKQDDGVVEGMEYDWFLRTQEIDYMLDIINTMELKNIGSFLEDGKEYVFYDSLNLQVKKYGDEWLIEE